MKLEEKIDYFKSLDLSKLPEAVQEGVMSQVEMFDEFGAEEMEGDAETVVLVDDLYQSVRKYVGDSPAQAKAKVKDSSKAKKYRGNLVTLREKKSGVRTANQNRAKSKQSSARAKVEEVVELPKTKRTPPSSTKRPANNKAEDKEAMADKKALAAKAKEEAKEAKKKATEAKKKAAKAEKIKAEKVALKGELKTLQGKVKDFAKLEEVLAKSLTNYVKNKFPQGLGATADTDKELEALKMKVKFYRSLLAKDKADYKALCVMLGIDYKISSPKRKASSGVAGLGKPKKKKAVSKKEPTFLSKLKNIFS
jgi:membrane protein involved in colicin uptake